jgi:hypothetical protein
VSRRKNSAELTGTGRENGKNKHSCVRPVLWEILSGTEKIKKTSGKQGKLGERMVTKEK